MWKYESTMLAWVPVWIFCKKQQYHYLCTWSLDCGRVHAWLSHHWCKQRRIYELTHFNDKAQLLNDLLKIIICHLDFRPYRLWLCQLPGHPLLAGGVWGRDYPRAWPCDRVGGTQQYLRVCTQQVTFVIQASTDNGWQEIMVESVCSRVLLCGDTGRWQLQLCNAPR